MKFIIATPSFRNSEWLKLCIPSVADQQGVELEHIVQDSCSDDGTGSWLPHDPRVRAFIEKDQGMYDAVNRGFKRGEGDYYAYLNCDEQYLPGALAGVDRYFQEHPEVDIAIADFIVTDERGDYLCHRYAVEPYWSHLWYRFSVSTSALFLRRRVLEEYGLFFQPQWKHLGDFFFFEEALRRGLRFGVLRQFTSIFTETGVNISWDHSTRPEEAIRVQRTPWYIKLARPLLLQLHRLRYYRSGAFQQGPFSYQLYTHQSPTVRVTKEVTKPTPLWPGRRRVQWGEEKGLSLQ